MIVAGSLRANGRGLPLQFGDYSAVVTTVGAGLARLTHAAVDLVHPLDLTRVPAAYEGKVLAPWPNRVRDGRWSWEGREHLLPISERTTGNALHGLACWQDWQVGARSAESVILHTTLPAQPGYPFRLELEAHYRLDPTGLTVTLVAMNDGVAPAPVGLGLHPYLTVGGARIDELTLEFAASAMLAVDERGLPAGEGAPDPDFTQPRLIGATTIDNPFRMPGPWAARLRSDRGGVELRSDSAWAHLYTGELIGRRGLAVEPTTCPPDAFNSGEALLVLGPGAEARLSCRIAALA